MVRWLPFRGAGRLHLKRILALWNRAERVDKCGFSPNNGIGRQGCFPLALLVLSGQPAANMHILYLDESGATKESRYFCVAGIAVFERESYFLTRDLDSVQQRLFPDWNQQAEFHASRLHRAAEKLKPPFDQLTPEQREEIRDSILRIIADSHARIFAVALDKPYTQEDPYERCFEEIVSRFDRMLNRLYQRDDQQRGLVVVAQSSYQNNLETLARRIWSGGHRWGDLRNMADVPFFAPAKNTRLLQLADFVSHAIYRRYESGDTRMFDRISHRLDSDEGVTHGLVHLAPDRRSCSCPACVQRRSRQDREE